MLFGWYHNSLLITLLHDVFSLVYTFCCESPLMLPPHFRTQPSPIFQKVEEKKEEDDDIQPPWKKIKK